MQKTRSLKTSGLFLAVVATGIKITDLGVFAVLCDNFKKKIIPASKEKGKPYIIAVIISYKI